MTLSGNVAQVNASVQESYVTFTPLQQPTMEGNILRGSDPIWIMSNEQGDFSATLTIGLYRVTVNGVNLIISILTNSDATLPDVVVGPPIFLPPGGAGGGAVDLSGSEHYYSNQSAWLLNHNLGYKPQTMVLDMNRIQMVSQVAHHIDNNTLVVTHTYLASGWIKIL